MIDGDRYMFDAKIFLDHLTNQPGVYQMLGSQGEILYIGKARQLKKRLASYFKRDPKDAKTALLIKQVANITVTITRHENEALLLECNLIKQYLPRFNILFRDDKSYPYIVISKDNAFPRIELYRGQRKEKALYFGPYPSTQAVRETINLIQKLFKLRPCSPSFFANRKRPCLQYQINRCSGPCVGLVTEASYQEQVAQAVLFLNGKSSALIERLTAEMEASSAVKHYELAAILRDKIIQLRQIQCQQYVVTSHQDADILGWARDADSFCLQLLYIRGGRMLGSRPYFTKIAVDAEVVDVVTAFISQHYSQQHGADLPKEIIIATTIPDQIWLSRAISEQAQRKVTISVGRRGEKLQWLTMAHDSAKQSLATYLATYGQLAERFLLLQTALNLTMPIKRIECFDISHMLGEATVASCVVFTSDEGACKNEYRRYNITGITPGDDFAAIRQALTRRYQRLAENVSKVPDLLLIDGGAGQVKVAVEVLASLNIQGVSLLGIAKGPGRKPGLEMLHTINKPPFSLSADMPALHLLQQIRDEAHRFALLGHQARRDKRRRASILEGIAGIGQKRRRELLRYFGGIQALTCASLDQIVKVPGINHHLATRIYETLHGPR